MEIHTTEGNGPVDENAGVAMLEGEYSVEGAWFANTS
jgi:hypothetical protein